jgi:acetyltransferase-like isoleucine patch superfamily enzyme
MASTRVWAHRAADTIGVIITFPLVGLFRIRLLRYATVSNGLALVPGAIGIVLRRSWYRLTLEACGANFVVDFGAGIRTPRTRVGDNCYVGLWSWIGWAEIGSDFMSGSHLVILSGRNQHHFERRDIPMRLQPGEHRCVKIGDDVWAGASVTIAEDVAPHTVIASGAVVTKTFAKYDILGGVPAAPIGNRTARTQQTTEESRNR